MTTLELTKKLKIMFKAFEKFVIVGCFFGIVRFEIKNDMLGT